MCCRVQEGFLPHSLASCEATIFSLPQKNINQFLPSTTASFTFSPFARYLLTQAWEHRRLYFLISAQSIQTWWCIDFTAGLTLTQEHRHLCTFSCGHSGPGAHVECETSGNSILIFSFAKKEKHAVDVCARCWDTSSHKPQPGLLLSAGALK